MSVLRRVGFAAVTCFLVLDCTACHHRVTASPPPAPAAGATLVVDFTWAASAEDNLGTSRTVVLSGRNVSAPRDSRFVSCFGSDKKGGTCQVVGDFNTTSTFTPGPEYDGSETISNAQLGRWQVTATGDSSGGASATQTCSVSLDSSRVVTLKMTLGVDPACSVQ